jgi:hypothetical protein
VIAPAFTRLLAIAYREGTWLVGGLIGFALAGPQHSYTGPAGALGALVGFGAGVLRARVIRVSRSGSDLVVQNFWSRKVVPVEGRSRLELGTAPFRGPWFPRFVTDGGQRLKVQAVTLLRDPEVATARLIEAAHTLQVPARP